MGPRLSTCCHKPCGGSGASASASTQNHTPEEFCEEKRTEGYVAPEWGESSLTGSMSITMTMLYVEKSKQHHDRADSSDLVSTSPSSTTQHNQSKARTLSVMKTPGSTLFGINALKMDKIKVLDFQQRLQANGIDTSSWGVHGTKTIEHLYWEVFEQRGCILLGGTGKEDPLKRVTRIIRLNILVDIYGVDHQLFSRLRFMHDGQSTERKQVLVHKLNWERQPQSGSTDVLDEHCPYTQSWKLGTRIALQDRMGLPLAWQERHLEEEVHSYSFRVEDDIMSSGYPGLVTTYCIHEVTLRVVDPESPGVHCIGLPTGQEFATSEGDFNLSSLDGPFVGSRLPIGTQLNIWTWSRVQATKKAGGPHVRKAVLTNKQGTAQFQTPDDCDRERMKRVPIPEAVKQNLSRISQRMKDEKASSAVPSPFLVSAQRGQVTDWTTAKRIAKRIADPDYSLKSFLKDLDCFPELHLYMLDCNEEQVKEMATGSGRTLGDEYQRTIGAFFAIYWLIRIASDGKRGFSFGVDKEWRPFSPPKEDSKDLYPTEKRLKFFNQIQWDQFERLLIDAQLLIVKKGKKGEKELKVNEKRVLTLLALTAFHDIMKVTELIPKVQPEHAPYHEYKAGDSIGDHDHALSYIMDHYPSLLPSFQGLDPQERLSVQFTQCQLQFNQGWLVQAEAPPGAIFTKFRELLIRDHQSKMEPRDIALYFVHWLTDLAGAEPTPLGGCEKFVVKFPLPVLNSFLRSFSFVEKIAEKTETEVMEDYLKMRWKEHEPSLGNFPERGEAIAKMRLVCMAQTNSMKILQGFDELSQDDKDILCQEMARTGCIGQHFSSHLAPKDVQVGPGGPAILVYYGPAFLQSLGADNPTARLSILAEVYRATRDLWPLNVKQVGSSVTVRIDTIKALGINEILAAYNQGEVWLLVKHNDAEAFVERSSRRKLNQFIISSQRVRILDING